MKAIEFLALKEAKKSFVAKYFVTFGLLFSAITLTSATAQASFLGIDEAIDATDQLITDLSQRRFDSAARLTVNSLVYASAEVLRSGGHGYEATALIADWNQNAFDMVGLSGKRALGDHQPLSSWLAKVYLQVEDKVGQMMKAIPILDDINTLNYSIPVVFQPAGKWRSNPERDWVEYRKHFIPFANVVTFWVSYGVCWVVTKKYAEYLEGVCEPGAKYLRKQMGRHWAPWLSDKVFSYYGKVPGMSTRAMPMRLADAISSEAMVQELNLGGFYEQH